MFLRQLRWRLPWARGARGRLHLLAVLGGLPLSLEIILLLGELAELIIVLAEMVAAGLGAILMWLVEWAFGRDMTLLVPLEVRHSSAVVDQEGDRQVWMLLCTGLVEAEAAGLLLTVEQEKLVS